MSISAASAGRRSGRRHPGYSHPGWRNDASYDNHSRRIQIYPFGTPGRINIRR